MLGNPGAFSRREKNSARKVFKAVWRHFPSLIGCPGLGQVAMWHFQPTNALVFQIAVLSLKQT